MVSWHYNNEHCRHSVFLPVDDHNLSAFGSLLAVNTVRIVCQPVSIVLFRNYSFVEEGSSPTSLVQLLSASRNVAFPMAPEDAATHRA